VVDKKTKMVICTAFSNGKRHDFRLFKESKTKMHPDIKVITDTGIKDCKSFITNLNCQKRKARKHL
jgi:hypothetical protein